MAYYNVCEKTQFIREKLTYHMKNAKMKMRWSMFLCFALAASFLLSGMTGALAAKSKKTSDTDAKLIAFTFDDGPGDYTDMLLDGLEERGAVATFFMTGENGTWGVKKYGKVMNRMIELNCQMANHTYNHKTFSKLTKGELQVAIDGMENYLFKAMGGKYNDLVRIPGGENSDNVSFVEHPVITWNLDSYDWKTRDTTAVYQAIMDNAKDGSIVLCHDLYPTSVQGALHAMDALAKEGYEFVTVSELFRRRGVDIKNGTIYSDATGKEVRLPARSAPELDVKETEEDHFQISVSNKEKDLTYYYTTDGSLPKLNSNKLDKNVKLQAGDRITVVGYDEYAQRTPSAEKTFKSHEELENEQLIAEKEEQRNNSFWVKIFRKLHLFGF